MRIPRRKNHETTYGTDTSSFLMDYWAAVISNRLKMTGRGLNTLQCLHNDVPKQKAFDVMIITVELRASVFTFSADKENLKHGANCCTCTYSSSAVFVITNCPLSVNNLGLGRWKIVIFCMIMLEAKQERRGFLEKVWPKLRRSTVISDHPDLSDAKGRKLKTGQKCWRQMELLVVFQPPQEPFLSSGLTVVRF